MSAEKTSRSSLVSPPSSMFCVRCFLLTCGFFLLPMLLTILQSFVAYHSKTNDVGSFIFYDIVFLFFVVPCAMLVSLLPLRIFKSGFVSRFLCIASIIVAIITSGYFARDLVKIGDRMFFRLHKGTFQQLASQAKPGGAAVVVFSRTEGSLIRWFVYFDSFKPPEGVLTKEMALKVSRTSDRFDEFSSCLLYATHLDGNFYMLSASC